MAGPAAILRELHRLRSHAKALQNELDRGPQKLKAQEAKVGRQEEVLRQAQEDLKRLKVATHDQELTLKTKVQQIAKHERQLNEAGNKKEYDALQAEINAEKRACSQLEDQILESMEETERQAARLPELEKAIKQTKEESARAVEDIQASRHGLMEQLNEVHKKIAEAEATLPEDIKPTYQRLLGARGEDALAPVNGRTCSACYTDVTAQNYQDLTQDRFLVCKSCGRILYLPG